MRLMMRWRSILPAVLTTSSRRRAHDACLPATPWVHRQRGRDFILGLSGCRPESRYVNTSTLRQGFVSPHLLPFPVTFIVYFSPTNVTFVSNPEVNPIWYPMEKVKAAINTTNAKVSNKSTNPRMKLQNFSMAPPFIGAGLFHSPPSCF